MASNIPKMFHADAQPPRDQQASYLYALVTGKRSVSRRNMASWYLRQLNKYVKCDSIETIERDDDVATGGQREESKPHSDGHSPTSMGDHEKDIFLVSIVNSAGTNQERSETMSTNDLNRPKISSLDSRLDRSLVTPNTRVLYLSKSIATSIILDLSPSVVSVSPQNDCVYLDNVFDALRKALQLLVKEHQFPSSQAERHFTLLPKVFVSVIAYTPFIVAKNNQVLVQNRRISPQNIEQVLVELWLCLNRLIQELHELVTSTCGIEFEYETNKSTPNAFVFASALNNGIIRHPGSVLDDIFELGLFSSSLMPRLSRLSIIIITDGLFASTNNLSTFRLKNIAVSFISLATESIYPDACFGYTTYNDLMKFVAKSTQGVYISHKELIEACSSLLKLKEISLMNNPLCRLFSWSLHSDIGFDEVQCMTPRVDTNTGLASAISSPTPTNDPVVEMKPEYIAKLFCIDQPVEAIQTSSSSAVDQAVDMDLVSNQNYHDWRSFKQMSRNLDADFEQVLSCLLREGYLIKSIQVKQRETSNIVARLVLYWKHNLNLEQELQAPYWNSTDPFELGDSSNLILKPFLAPTYGDTYCELIVHGSYNFLHDFYCDKKLKRRSDYRAVAYLQFEHLILGVKQTYDKLQYLSRYYRDSSLSKVPSFLLHGNSLLFEQPHTHNITPTIDNVVEKTRQAREFTDYWQEISKLELRSWKNIMHVHTLRLVLEHDQPKYKNIHSPNANGRYTHIQCRRAMSAISNFIRGYATFSLLEDSLYIRFIHNKEDDLRDIETSATKGFVVIKIKKLLPIVVIYLMFTSGILDLHRAQIVDHIESLLMNCKLRNARTSTVQPPGSAVSAQTNSILKSKIIYSTSDSCCALIRSPLERMLRVYSRSMMGEFLFQNLTHGLPGSCPLNTVQRSLWQGKSNQKLASNNQQDESSGQHNKPRNNITSREDQLEDDTNLAVNSRYNPVFGKYLYGIRVVHTIANLPHDLVQQMVHNVLVKIAAILTNIRIKQGFHIAFNNSGLLTLVAELELKDLSHDHHSSNCLCQYLVFPPTITNCCPHVANVAQNIVSSGHTSGTDNLGKPGSLCGSLGNSDNTFLRHDLSTSTNLQNSDNQGEIKVIREYWIEQQYGLSTKSNNYHKSLENMRYSEIVDHLYATDMTVFNSLLTYDLLQLLCDRMSPFYDLDVALSQTESRGVPLSSPTNSTTSSCMNQLGSPTVIGLPSSLIDGTSKDGQSRLPLIEVDYQFSIVSFLDYCQFAGLDVVLFREKSEFCEPIIEKETVVPLETSNTDNNVQSNQIMQGGKKESRRLSVDVTNSDLEHTRREHKSSYDSLNANSSGQSCLQPIIGYSLNHLFLETLYKRLKQIHDKELRLSDHDRREMTSYLRRRRTQLEFGDDTQTLTESPNQSPMGESDLSRSNSGLQDEDPSSKKTDTLASEHQRVDQDINWRCFMRKGNQENMMIVLIPDSLDDVKRWMNLVEHDNLDPSQQTGDSIEFFRICPIFVFRCSSTMINSQVLSFLDEDSNPYATSDLDSSPGCRPNAGSDLLLHFGQPCRYINTLRALNDELYNEILPLSKFSELSQGISDENTQEFVHFRAYLRKIKNTVLKSRFSSLNDAYLSELFVHKDDISYYINNVDSDIQKKYHVSSHLRSLAEFIKSYEDYHDLLPKEPSKQCNQLLNSILLQKCGLFINQPIARFDESNPLMKQLHDRKLLFMMRCNYKIELPILEENLTNSKYLRSFLQDEPATERIHQVHHQKVTPSKHHHAHQQLGANMSGPNSIYSCNSECAPALNGNQASSLGRNSNNGSRLMEMKCGSIGSSGLIPSGTSPVDSVNSSLLSGVGNSQLAHERIKYQFNHGTSSSYVPNLILNPSSDGFFLEAFKNSTCAIDEVMQDCETHGDIGLRHEAHMAEVLKRKGERKESHQYRRVLRSKANYSQSHGAIDQALKKVDSLGRLEHFCLTPLLFSPAWRSKLAPVRDHTVRMHEQNIQPAASPSQDPLAGGLSPTGSSHPQQASMLYNGSPSEQDEVDRWHQTICNNYIKEYEQYVQTLGFNSVQIRFPSSSKLQTSLSASNGFSNASQQGSSKSASRKTSLQASTKYSSSRRSGYGRKDSSTNSPSSSFIPITTSSASMNIASTNSSSVAKGHGGVGSNTGYLIKFLNSGCLVFKVGFCKPYVYSILYSIEGERFNNSNTKVNMMAFLDELDSIKVTLHLHSFTYDYHLRSMYSYISRRQISFNPGYHLISFADDFRKYYQKAPNYARNHILSGEVGISNLKVDGQQLYNYIVTHNSIYHLEVLEMTNTVRANFMNSLAAGHTSSGATEDVTDANRVKTATQQFASFLSSQFGTAGVADGKLTDTDDGQLFVRDHANNYVLIELKREKVRYKDGKEPDIFDCGLLIAHDFQQTNASKNCLVLRYFLILTNQRDLYPKLLHTGDTLIELGCHRPIRLGVVDQLAANVSATTKAAMKTINETSDSNDTTLIEQHLASYGSSVATTTILNSADLDDVQSASEFLSSSELSGSQSMLSAINSIQSSSSTGLISQQQRQASTRMSASDTEANLMSVAQKSLTDSGLMAQLATEEAAEALMVEEVLAFSKKTNTTQDSHDRSQHSSANASLSGSNGADEMVASTGGNSADRENKKSNGSLSAQDEMKSVQQQHERERTICDEEITYLGYFSSDELDMLKFLQEKTASLKSHLEHIVRQAEIHFRRDYLWHKLMQRQSLSDQSTSLMGSRSSSAADQMPLTLDELIHLLSIVDAIDLEALDSNLSTFTSMHISWYPKLIKAFSEFKLSPAGNQHRIYAVKASKILLLYIDPKCTTAFVLLTVNSERGSVELSMLLKDKQDCCNANPSGAAPDQMAAKQSARSSPPGDTKPAMIDLDADCQQLISDFINFCATFMWSNLLT